MRRFLMTHLLVGLLTALLLSPAFAQQRLTWWEHSNPPHNNYSKKLVAEWNKMHPKIPCSMIFSR